MFALVAITLPVAVGASLLTFIIIKRRRLSMLCRREGAQQGKMMQLNGSGYESGSDEEQLEGKLPRTKVSGRPAGGTQLRRLQDSWHL